MGTQSFITSVISHVFLVAKLIYKLQCLFGQSQLWIGDEFIHFGKIYLMYLVRYFLDHFRP